MNKSVELKKISCLLSSILCYRIFCFYLNFSYIKTEDISEFEGSHLAKDLRIIEDYVNGIPTEVKKYKQHTP